MPNFLYRREMGIINVGGNGSVIVEGTSNVLGFKDALYIGSGNVEVIFESYDTKTS
jgi:4-deoxy-L-threo-5-hexosulose-uronate ketol-isomerase